MIILKKWVRGFLSFFVFLRFKDVWNLYDWLLAHHKTSGLHASVFSHYVDQQCAYIGIGAKFANRAYFPHGLHGIFISDESVIGRNAVIFQQVTIGAVRTAGSKHPGNPVIGDNVYIGAGAKILGGIHIGNNCRIGANACVYEDMPDNSVAVCAPTRIIRADHELDNRFYLQSDDGTGTLFYWDGEKYVKVEEQNEK